MSKKILVAVVSKNICETVISPIKEGFSDFKIKIFSPMKIKEFMGIEVVNDEEVLAKSDFNKYYSGERSGWYYQQILKYEIVLKSKFDYVYIIDGDSIPSNTLLRSDLVCYNSKIIEEQYCSFLSKFGLNDSRKRNYITNQMMFNKVALKKMLLDISPDNWQEKILSAVDEKSWFSEYQVYASYCVKLKTVSERKIKVFRRFDLIKKFPDDALNKYHVLAYEPHHKTGFLRIMRAKLFYFLSLEIG